MSRPIIRIHNTETDEIIDRQMNDEEYSKWQEQCLEYEELQKEIKQVEIKKAAAQAKLAALGLTADDLRALGL